MIFVVNYAGVVGVVDHYIHHHIEDRSIDFFEYPHEVWELLEHGVGSGLLVVVCIAGFVADCNCTSLDNNNDSHLALAEACVDPSGVVLTVLRLVDGNYSR